jgi:hypothetical protein
VASIEGCDCLFLCADAANPPCSTRYTPCMQKGQEGASDEQGAAHKTEPDLARTVANVSEPLLAAASVGAGLTAVLRAAAGEVPVFGPIVASAVAGLLPVLVAADQRRREAKSARAEQARSWADEAWDAMISARAI